MLAALCQQVNAWQLAEKKATRARRALDLAERVYDAYQDRQKQELDGAPEADQPACRPDLLVAAPGGRPRCGQRRALDGEGSRARRRFLRLAQRPPHGVLSESHLNSLAIALFLAMAQTFNQKLGFLVLDDVINSFDLEHRGELAELLAERFDDWQLMVLTHDHQFFDHLSRRAPSWKRLELTSWSYAAGPRTTSTDQGILGRPGAPRAGGRQRRRHQGPAGTGRALAGSVRGALGAPPVPAGQANDQREIGELFKGVRRDGEGAGKGMLGMLEPLLKIWRRTSEQR